jgi:hypothetical protein
MSEPKEWSDLSVEERAKRLQDALAAAISETGGDTSAVPDNRPAAQRPTTQQGDGRPLAVRG